MSAKVSLFTVDLYEGKIPRAVEGEDAMQLIEDRPLEYGGKLFALKLFAGDDSYTLIPFFGTERHGPSYRVSFAQVSDYLRQKKESLIEELFEAARFDIEQPGLQ